MFRHHKKPVSKVDYLKVCGVPTEPKKGEYPNLKVSLNVEGSQSFLNDRCGMMVLYDYLSDKPEHRKFRLAYNPS